jgi:hypothetical protein
MIILLFSPNVSAGEDANIDEDLTITATPSQQGVGGKITLDILVTFYGGCCYPLYAFDIEPELQLPGNIEIVDKVSPEKINKFEATAGGGAVQAKFQCTIRSFIPGEYEIPIKVSTSNCGNAEGSAKITVTEGCVISIPELYPDQPSTGRDINIIINAYSPLENVEIKNVSLYFLTESSEIIKDPDPKGEILNWSGGSEAGSEIIFQPMEFEENQWQGNIPKQSDEAFLTYWIVAEDNFGNITTSPAYIIEVKNLEQIHFQHSSLVWGAIIACVIGIIIIGIVWNYVSRNPALKAKLSGALIIGSAVVDIKSTNADKLNYQKRMNNFRNLALLIILISTLILLYIAIQSGQYELLRTNVGG